MQVLTEAPVRRCNAQQLQLRCTCLIHHQLWCTVTQYYLIPCRVWKVQTRRIPSMEFGCMVPIIASGVCSTPNVVLLVFLFSVSLLYLCRIILPLFLLHKAFKKFFILHSSHPLTCFDLIVLTLQSISVFHSKLFNNSCLSEELCH